jgi:hypothetical protein
MIALRLELPKKQIIDHGALGWKNSGWGEEESEEVYVLHLVEDAPLPRPSEVSKDW